MLASLFDFSKDPPIDQIWYFSGKSGALFLKSWRKTAFYLFYIVEAKMIRISRKTIEAFYKGEPWTSRAVFERYRKHLFRFIDGAEGEMRHRRRLSGGLPKA